MPRDHPHEHNGDDGEDNAQYRSDVGASPRGGAVAELMESLHLNTASFRGLTWKAKV